MLRPGAIARDAIEKITGPLATPSSGAIAAPGMMESHYAPRARMLLDVTAPPPDAAYLAFGTPAPPGGLSLSPSGDLTEAAANLYAHLRALDATGAGTIAVAPVPGDGLAEAIRDRLARAAAPR
ncbi:MAG: Sua5 family C-terminal domain-containing protein [Hyphomonadaceae bacterium]